MTARNIYQMLQKKSKSFYAFTALVSIIDSVVFGGVFYLINITVAQSASPFFLRYGWVVFIALLLLSLVSRKLYQQRITYLTNELLYDFEIVILQKLRFASYQVYENLGTHRVYAVQEDVKTLARLPTFLVDIINCSAMLCCGLVYLFLVSPEAGAGLAVAILLLFVFYTYKNRRLAAEAEELRDLSDTYFVHLQDLLLGFKEIKMSIAKSEAIFHKYLKVNRFKKNVLESAFSLKHFSNELIGVYSWYVLIGIILFGLPAVISLKPAQIAILVSTILFLMGPIGWLIRVFPHFLRMHVAWDRIKSFEADLQAGLEQEDYGDLTEINATFTGIRFENVMFEYIEKQKKFTLGPLNLEIKAGETIFITGGNGSGKSTFVQLLTGLYRPTTGRILLNGHPVTARNYPYYSNQVSAIFTSPYLFDENYDGFVLDPSNRELADLLAMMELSDVVSVQGGHRILGKKLSKGQQKRLALIYALLEHRSVLVLDEWAAEQDPRFRESFYRRVLPRLKSMGKTIIAVTHDDRYFNEADRIIQFDYGTIVISSLILPDRQPAALPVAAATGE